MIVSTKGFIATLRINDAKHNNTAIMQSVASYLLFIVMLNVIMLNNVMLRDLMLNVTMLSIVMLSVRYQYV